MKNEDLKEEMLFYTLYKSVIFEEKKVPVLLKNNDLYQICFYIFYVAYMILNASLFYLFYNNFIHDYILTSIILDSIIIYLPLVLFGMLSKKRKILSLKNKNEVAIKLKELNKEKLIDHFLKNHNKKDYGLEDLNIFK